MRLIQTASETLAQTQLYANIPPYAILSHVWDEEEVSFQDWDNLATARSMAGFDKIAKTCRQAQKDELQYAWVDTNCIDKTSSAELTEAINSMFAWYRDSTVCYVYLADVEVPVRVQKHVAANAAKTEAASAATATPYLDDPRVRQAFRESKWFCRGWTLQELLAPSRVIFYSKEWLPLATKDSAKRLISDITGIDLNFLTQPDLIFTATVAQRMSWAAHRKTSRIEDTAYCLLGIFSIHMALLYGEQHRAFLRLQEEIIRVSNDQTIFCWQANLIDATQRSGPIRTHTRTSSAASTAQAGAHTRASASSRKIVQHLHNDRELYSSLKDGAPLDAFRYHELEQWTSILAPHPNVFQNSSSFQSVTATAIATAAVQPYSITNFGLSIALPLLYTANGACAVLDVEHRQGSRARPSRVVIVLHRLEGGHFVRLAPRLLVTEIPPALLLERTPLFVDCRNAEARHARRLLLQRNTIRTVLPDATAMQAGGTGGHCGNTHGRLPLLFATFSVPVDVDRTAHAATGMVYQSFHSFVEVKDSHAGAQGTILLAGRTLGQEKPFYMLVAGRSNSVPPPWLLGDSSDLSSSTSSRPSTPGTPRTPSTPGTSGLSVTIPSMDYLSSSSPSPPPTRLKATQFNWHIDVWDFPTPDPTRWTEQRLRPLLAQLPNNVLSDSSWCPSPAVRDVLAWRTSPLGGALFCHVVLNDLRSVARTTSPIATLRPGLVTDISRKVTAEETAEAEERLRFRQLREIRLPMTTLGTIYATLHGLKTGLSDAEGLHKTSTGT